MPREIVVDWTTINGAGKVSVFHFGESAAVAGQRQALNTYLTSIAAGLTTATTYSIRTSGRDIDAATGDLTASWVDLTARTGTGAGSGQPVADATQVLAQWHTQHIVGKRFLVGRTFIPGLASGNTSGGNVVAGIVTSYTAAGNTLIGAAVQMGVWHRPSETGPGIWWAAQSATVWPEFAVLRRRRG